VTTGNMYDGTATQTMTVGTIDNCLTHDAAQLPDPNTQHNHVVNLIVQNVEDIAGAQARFNHDDTKAEVTNLNWTPFSDPNTLSPVGFLNLPIDPTATDHRAVTQTSDFSQPGTSLSAASYLGTQDAAISPDTPAKPAPDGNTSYSAPTGGILANVVIQVKAGQQGQASLTIDLDDANPTPPGTSVDIFTAQGIVKMPVGGFQLGDGFIGEGVTCVAGAQETAPPATPTPTLVNPTPTPTATGGGGGGGGAGGSATPSGGARTGTPRTSPAASPAALPPTGTSAGGGSSPWTYVLLLGAGMTASASGAFGLYRLRKR